MRRTYFDGQITHSPPVGGGTFWLDEWWGPGGKLVVSQLLVPSADYEETLTTPDGEVLTSIGLEREDYQLLPQLFGPELWARFQEERRESWGAGATIA